MVHQDEFLVLKYHNCNQGDFDGRLLFLCVLPQSLVHHQPPSTPEIPKNLSQWYTDRTGKVLGKYKIVDINFNLTYCYVHFIFAKLTVEILARENSGEFSKLMANHQRFLPQI